MVSQLPKVKIDGIQYFMDARLREYRRIPTKRGHISLSSLMPKKFEEVTNSNKVELITPRQVFEDSKVHECLTMQEYDELVDLGIKNKKILYKIPICKNH